MEKEKAKATETQSPQVGILIGKDIHGDEKYWFEAKNSLAHLFRGSLRGGPLVSRTLKVTTPHS